MSRYTDALRELKDAQKAAARSAPAYSRFVNRRLGRFLAAGAHVAGLSPNQVTGISALFTLAGIVGLATLPLTWGTGVAVAAALVLGYALDSADGQVARLQRRGSSAGEWLDHVVDAGKSVMLPLGLLVGLWRAPDVDDRWLAVPLVSAVVTSVLFFAMILTEQLRRARGVQSRAPEGGRGASLRSLLVLPMDYGVLCWSFVLIGALPVFLVAYTLITAASAAFLVLACGKWYAELKALDQGARPAVTPDAGPAAGRVQVSTP
ncbi:CDP-alcohol phosphatidyltransferase family protein [Cellulomonas sp. CW35]|uniref:CDP-alcohol phosphatidyltransferase family protein n=1 Tax=Cellulomonas TaxID=1707 RepID=UPI000B8D61D6|nr:MULTISPECIES: CDP-alcohol phosphatidyltransferase family protein [Cellulomonas]ASR56534.1 CDP-alcohol phosphatidyltransferase [Cellulomonas sp. PSBB021]UJP41133.1 CDP-alcohol phosphatidyltransferase family protein [Cellulomonas palmilytica]